MLLEAIKNIEKVCVFSRFYLLNRLFLPNIVYDLIGFEMPEALKIQPSTSF